MGSKREVAMNRNFRHGDMLCPSCNAAGRHAVLKPDNCPTCGKATCFVCRGASDERGRPHAHAHCCAVKKERTA